MGYGDKPSPALIVTLQKGASTAACEFAIANWSVQYPDSLNASNPCDTFTAQ
jgi:hypothetical protein